MTDVELTRALERGEIPNQGFHHVDHLRVALVYLNESDSVDAAVARMASTLKRFAASVGQAMAAARAVMPSADCQDLVRAYPRLLDKNLIDER